jgi:hypothetical protein
VTAPDGCPARQCRPHAAKGSGPCA